MLPAVALPISDILSKCVKVTCHDYDYTLLKFPTLTNITNNKKFILFQAIIFVIVIQ